MGVAKVAQGGVRSLHLQAHQFREIFRVLWFHVQQGVVEQGSSGSAAFLTLQGKRYVVGQLFRGSSSCSNPQGTDDYGRFDVSYRSALSKWLNP